MIPQYLHHSPKKHILIIFIFSLLTSHLVASNPPNTPIHELQKHYHYISPRPHATWVPSQTTIAIRPSYINSVTLLKTIQFEVSGSQSGFHQGQIILAGDDETLIFKPTTPFTPEEIVTVALTASSIPPIHYSFQVAPTLPNFPLTNAWQRLLMAHHTTQPVAFADYKTAPADLPAFQVTISNSHQLADGYLFIGYFDYFNFLGSNPYMLILDNNSEPIYYNQLAPEPPVIDFKRQHLHENLVTWYDNALDEQKFYVMDETYTIIDSYVAGNGYLTDVHDLQILEDGRALLMIYDNRIIDMSQRIVGGHPEALVVGCILQEVDNQGNVLFEWRSWDHIDILDTNQDVLTDTIDYIHCNSIERGQDGHWLLSSRHLDEITKIDRNTGDILWRLGGVQSDFTFPNDTGFAFQHDARQLANGHITLYDNGNTHGPPPYSRGVEYVLDEDAMTATLVWEYRNTPDTFGPFMGNLQRLPNGNSLIGWGGSDIPLLTEVAPDGTKLMDLNSTIPNHGSYRAVRYEWHGYPTWSPRLVAINDGPAIDLYFSWNGATEVTDYEVYAGTTPTTTTLLDTVVRTGFETTYHWLPPSEGFWYFQVLPITGDGSPVQFSNIAATIVNGQPTYIPLLITHAPN